jgi:hypothetical protein
MPHLMPSHVSNETQSCINECLACYEACEATFAHCIVLGGKHAEPTHLRLLIDCSRVCSAAADFMLRGSDFDQDLCEVCAEICRQCAENCEQIDPTDEMMRECAGQCRTGAAACERMVNSE